MGEWRGGVAGMGDWGCSLKRKYLTLEKKKRLEKGQLKSNNEPGLSEKLQNSERKNDGSKICG